MSIPEPVIYQLKVVLQGISPMIWHRLLVCGDSTIADLHYIIQIAMGWSGDHLHQFRIHGKRYGIARMGGISFSDDPMVRKGKVVRHANRTNRSSLLSSATFKKNLGVAISRSYRQFLSLTDNFPKWQGTDARLCVSIGAKSLTNTRAADISGNCCKIIL
jgi:hypothetical protein